MLVGRAMAGLSRLLQYQNRTLAKDTCLKIRVGSVFLASSLERGKLHATSLSRPAADLRLAPDKSPSSSNFSSVLLAATSSGPSRPGFPLQRNGYTDRDADRGQKLSVLGQLPQLLTPSRAAVSSGGHLCIALPRGRPS